MMVLDLHVHTFQGSGDSNIEYRDVVPRAREAGLDGICITEHGVKKTGLAEKLAREYDFLVLEGMETSTELGDILVFGLDSLPRTLYRAADMRDYVEKAGGVMIAAHPFRSEITRPIMLKTSPRLTLEDACRRPILNLVDGIEVANGWSAEEDVEFCLQLSARMGLRATGGSDAHLPQQIGCCITIFENGIRSEADLVAELKRGRFLAQDRRRKEQKGPNYWFS
ncbi:MAG: PHP-associated domain-containing protein [Dehalococcoidia bacterium]